MTLLETFLSKIKVIKDLQPRYVSGGSGTNGTCDCVGLVIGALRRSGIKYSGIHGSNWFARKEVQGLAKINSIDDLKIGDAVFQTYEPGQTGYELPGRYKKGGAYYNGDVRDYMHIGIVTSLNPLRITHMWKPSVKDDTTLQWWTYKGWITKLGAEPIDTKIEPKTPTNNCRAKVTAPSGKTVNLRLTPSLKGRLLAQIRIGTEVEILVPGETWAQIKWKDRTGYMMAKFLKVVE